MPSYRGSNIKTFFKKLQKVSINFSKYADAAFGAKAAYIVTSITGNAYFPTPTPELATLQAALAEYNLAFAAAADLGKNNVARKNAARLTLEDLLRQLGLYVMNVSNGNVHMQISSGFDLTKQPQPRYITDPGMVELFNGPASGQMVAMVDTVAGATGYVYEITDTAPTEATNWTSIATTTRKYTFTELTPGRQYWVRVAATGSRQQLLYSTVYSQYAQ